MDGFIGRKIELEKLKSVLELRSASLIVINGRRRIGKSRLIEEFAKNQRDLFFDDAGSVVLNTNAVAIVAGLSDVNPYFREYSGLFARVE